MLSANTDTYSRGHNNSFFIRLQKELSLLGFAISIDELRSAIAQAPESELFRKMITWLSVQIIEVRELKNVEPIEFSYSVPLFIRQLRIFLTDIGCDFISSNEPEYLHSQYVRNVDTLLEYMTTELAAAMLLKDRSKRSLNTKVKKKGRTKNTHTTQSMNAYLSESEWNRLAPIYNSLFSEYRSEREKTLKNLKTTITSLMQSCRLDSRKKEFFDEINRRISMIPVLPDVLPEDVIHVRNVLRANEQLMALSDPRTESPVSIGKSDTVSNAGRRYKEKEPDLVHTEKRNLSSLSRTDTTTSGNFKEGPTRDHLAMKCRTEMKSERDTSVLKDKITKVSNQINSIREHYQSLQRREEAIKNAKNKENNNNKTPEIHAGEKRPDRQGIRNEGLECSRITSLHRKTDEITRDGKLDMVHNRKVVPDRFALHQDHKKNRHQDNVISMQSMPLERKPHENHPEYQPIASKSLEDPIVQKLPRRSIHVHTLPPSPPFESMSIHSSGIPLCGRTSPPQPPMYRLVGGIPVVQHDVSGIIAHTNVLEREKLVPCRDFSTPTLNIPLKRNHDYSEGEFGIKRNIIESRFCESDSTRNLGEPYQSEVINSMSLVSKRDPSKTETSIRELIQHDPIPVHHIPREVGNTIHEWEKRDPRLTPYDPSGVGSSMCELAQYHNYSEVGNLASKLIKRDPRLVQHDSSVMGNSMRTLTERDPRLVHYDAREVDNSIHVLAQRDQNEVGSSVQRMMIGDRSTSRNSMREQVDVNCRNYDRPGEQLNQTKRGMGSNDGDNQIHYDHRCVEDPSRMWNNSKYCGRNDDDFGPVNRDIDMRYREGSSGMWEGEKSFDSANVHRGLEYRYNEGHMDLYNQAECMVGNNDHVNSVLKRDLNDHGWNDKNTVTVKSDYGQGNEYVPMHGRSEHIQEVDMFSNLQHHLGKGITDNTNLEKRTESHAGKWHPDAKKPYATKHVNERDKSVHKYPGEGQNVSSKKFHASSKSDCKIPQKRSKSRTSSSRVTERSRRAGSRREKNSHGRDRGH